MSITVEAVYEDGVLKPSQALPLKEHQPVRVTVETSSPSGSSSATRAAGLARLLTHAGAVDLGRSPGADNASIDADLARE